MKIHEPDKIPVYYGPPLERPFAAVLNSRQSKTPCGADPWVRGCLTAVEHLAREGGTILTSTGMHTWNLLTWAAGHFGANQIQIQPLYPDESPEAAVNEIIQDFALSPEKTGFAFYRTNCARSRPKDAWLERDRQIVKLSDRILPVSMRVGGNLSSEVSRFAPKWAKIDERFKVDYSRACAFRPKMSDLAKAAFNSFEPWRYLTHWTHSFSEPWPGESAADFYRAIACSESAYPRSAEKSLERILGTHSIIGTCLHHRGDIPVVSFTELAPNSAIRLMKWDPHIARMTFEPYGIAIERDIARELGLREVVYGDETVFEGLSEEDRPFFQPVGRKTDWSGEHEWRYPGDLNLNDIPHEALTALVPSQAEAEGLEARFGFPAKTIFAK